MRDWLANGLGVLLLGLGVWTVVDVDIFARAYDVGLPNPLSRTTIRAIIGGGEIGFAIMLLLRRCFDIPTIAILRISAAVFCGIIGARMVSILVEQTYSAELIMELLAEILIAAALIFAARNP